MRKLKAMLAALLLTATGSVVLALHSGTARADVCYPPKPTRPVYCLENPQVCVAMAGNPDGDSDDYTNNETDQDGDAYVDYYCIDVGLPPPLQ
ncbi:MAG: hypothetical protein QOD07_1955 [Frankiaceae bacterium]|nr:hypothetical protein [Frankiaceae bacterium]